MKELVAQDLLNILGEINFGKDYKGIWESGRHNVEEIRSYQGHYYECLLERSPMDVSPPDEDQFGWKRYELKEKKGEPVKAQRRAPGGAGSMEGKVNDGGPAFPCVEHFENVTEKGNSFYERIFYQGASLRAAAAIAAMPQAMLEAQRDPREAARIALEHADALLEALDA